MNLLTQHQSVVALTASKAIATSRRGGGPGQGRGGCRRRQAGAIAKRQADLKREVAKYKALLATLTAAERAKYYNPVPQPSATTVAQVMVRAVRSATGRPGTPRAAPAAAISEARAQLGKPYAWGGSGPDSFDCSGLTAWAWRAAGVSLPHNAAAQQGMGTPVSRGDLQPGDLVFFGSPAYHVGIYVGDGMMIHAPTSGDVVKMSPLSYMSDYSGATRVG